MRSHPKKRHDQSIPTTAVQQQQAVSPFQSDHIHTSEQDQADYSQGRTMDAKVQLKTAQTYGYRLGDMAVQTLMPPRASAVQLRPTVTAHADWKRGILQRSPPHPPTIQRVGNTGSAVMAPAANKKKHKHAGTTTTHTHSNVPPSPFMVDADGNVVDKITTDTSQNIHVPPSPFMVDADGNVVDKSSVDTSQNVHVPPSPFMVDADGNVVDKQKSTKLTTDEIDADAQEMLSVIAHERQKDLLKSKTPTIAKVEADVQDIQNIIKSEQQRAAMLALELGYESVEHMLDDEDAQLDLASILSGSGTSASKQQQRSTDTSHPSSDTTEQQEQTIHATEPDATALKKTESFIKTKDPDSKQIPDDLNEQELGDLGLSQDPQHEPQDDALVSEEFDDDAMATSTAAVDLLDEDEDEDEDQINSYSIDGFLFFQLEHVLNRLNKMEEDALNPLSIQEKAMHVVNWVNEDIKNGDISTLSVEDQERLIEFIEQEVLQHKDELQAFMPDFMAWHQSIRQIKAQQMQGTFVHNNKVWTMGQALLKKQTQMTPQPKNKKFLGISVTEAQYGHYMISSKKYGKQTVGMGAAITSAVLDPTGISGKSLRIAKNAYAIGKTFGHLTTLEYLKTQTTDPTIQETIQYIIDQKNRKLVRRGVDTAVSTGSTLVASAGDALKRTGRFLQKWNKRTLGNERLMRANIIWQAVMNESDPEHDVAVQVARDVIGPRNFQYALMQGRNGAYVLSGKIKYTN